ncbi:MAG TPA: protein kinase, partial [Thermaerobacter sp.]
MIGTVLAGRYRVTGLLGGGGMAVVYKATDQVTGETVAVKALRSEYVSDGAFLRRLRREAEAVRRLSHPGVVAVLDVGEDAGHPFLVLEYVEGITLKQYIREKAPLPLREAVHIASRVLSVLQHAHENGVIHRDVKPQNILITPDARVMVTDFGIARASGTTTTVVDQGAMVGTAQYFAPEQARGMPASERSDVYAVGIILFEMLTGRLPFDGDTPVAVAMQHLGQEPPLPSALNPRVPRALEAIVLKALEKNPDRRYPSAGAMLEDLENFLAGRPVAALARRPLEDTLVAGPSLPGGAAGKGAATSRNRPRSATGPRDGAAPAHPAGRRGSGAGPSGGAPAGPLAADSTPAATGAAARAGAGGADPGGIVAGGAAAGAGGGTASSPAPEGLAPGSGNGRVRRPGWPGQREARPDPGRDDPFPAPGTAGDGGKAEPAVPGGIPGRRVASPAGGTAPVPVQRPRGAAAEGEAVVLAGAAVPAPAGPAGWKPGGAGDDDPGGVRVARPGRPPRRSGAG